MGAARRQLFQITAVFSMIFALIGFSYNVWRMEISEHNNTMRSASFELLLQLSELEAIVYAAHYDNNLIEGNPRKGWIKVNLVHDLALITTPELQQQTKQLKAVWQQNWSLMAEEQHSSNAIIAEIDNSRAKVRQLLSSLQ
ncbi:hypothetical protein [Shewanella waksmanii]|uniref:hypothetical protein n=1 Tax=Shewanella waksmanii TaxID=213783 RepID=UPI003736ECA7